MTDLWHSILLDKTTPKIQPKASLKHLTVLCLTILHVFLPTEAGNHGGKFGYPSGVSLEFESRIDEIQGFPNSNEFFKNYVFKSKPLLMKGAAKSTQAYKLWQSDEYFLTLKIPDDELFTVETKKKENRTQEILDLNFEEFLKTYEKEERYMVHRVPQFLGQDVMVPDPLQCEDIIQDSIVEAIMWFSGGGTKSVVHTDSVDNMNCVYVGSKHFVMIDPHKYASKVMFDHPEGAYSDIDVDNVDYEKYSGLMTVDYQHVDLDQGDCLFIPYKWIHQVRSFGSRNIAINIWWDTHRNEQIDLSQCNQQHSQPYTLNDVNFIGFEAVFDSLDAISDQFHDFTRHGDLPIDKYTDMMLGDREPENLGAGMGYTIPIQQLYKVIDKDGDGVMTYAEVQQVDKNGWKEVQNHMSRLDAILVALDERWEELQSEESEIHERDEL